MIGAAVYIGGYSLTRPGAGVANISAHGTGYLGPGRGGGPPHGGQLVWLLDRLPVGAHGASHLETIADELAAAHTLPGAPRKLNLRPGSGKNG